MFLLQYLGKKFIKKKLFICNNMTNKYIVWFDEVGLSDVALVGGKNSSLGEMICNLKQLGIQVPFGFAITTHAYQYFLE